MQQALPQSEQMLLAVIALQRFAYHLLITTDAASRSLAKYFGERLRAPASDHPVKVSFMISVLIRS